MSLLTVNSGSSSARLAGHSVSGEEVRELFRRRHSLAEGLDPRETLARAMSEHGSPAAILHRVVVGGEPGQLAVRIDAEVERGIEAATPRAPLHNPVALEWIRAARAEFPDSDAIALFDTGFFAALPRAATEYALPAEYRQTHGIRRCGFHGLAHRALWRSWSRHRPDLERGGRILTLQLGSGASITALDRGVPRDTSMGYTPLEGLVMATRSGDVDPGALLHLIQHGGIDPAELGRALSTRSGLLGLSESDDRIDALMAASRPEARLAVDVYLHRIHRYVGAFLHLLGGIDGVVFGGGVGENSPEVRARVVKALSWCGAELDEEANRAAVGREGRISRRSSKIDVWVIPVDEATEMIDSARDLWRMKHSENNEEVDDG